MSTLILPRPALVRASALALVAVLSGCAGMPRPFAQLDGHRYHLTPIDTYAVKVVRVDGHDEVFSPVFIEPGLRKVTVQGPPSATSAIGQERSIDLNVAPCIRYYLVAVKPNRLMADFSVKVDYEEPIGGCSAPATS